MPTRKAIPGIRAHGITLTPEILAAAYEYLRATPPFNRWKLPSATHIKFIATKAAKTAGHCEVLDSGKICVAVSDTLHGHSQAVLTTMAHEMVHVWQFLNGKPGTHGAIFKQKAEQICRKHGFDPLGF